MLWWHASRDRSLGAMLLAGVAAVSTRPQFALTLAALAGLLAAAALLPPRDGPRRLRPMVPPALLRVVVAAGFSLDLRARHAAGTGERVRTSSAVTLYSGLLVSDGGPPWCGHWAQAATQAARDDRDRPLLDVIGTRLSGRPAGHWAGVVWCKFAHHVVPPDAFALYWAAEPLRERAGAAPSPDQKRTLGAVHWLQARESWLFGVLVLAIYAAAVAVAVRAGAGGAWWPCCRSRGCRRSGSCTSSSKCRGATFWLP